MSARCACCVNYAVAESIAGPSSARPHFGLLADPTGIELKELRGGDKLFPSSRLFDDARPDLRRDATSGPPALNCVVLLIQIIGHVLD